MKKLLTLVLSLVIGLGCMVSLAACNGSGNAEIVEKALQSLKTMYETKDLEVRDGYDVVGQVKVDQETYPVVWTADSDNVSIGEMDAVTKRVHIGITPADEAIEYNLTATVTVGKTSDSVTFARKILAKPKAHAGTEEDPYLPSNILEVAKDVEARSYYGGNDNPTSVVVEGYIVDTGKDYTTYASFIYIVDEYSADKDRNSADAIMIASISYKADSLVTRFADLKKGDYIKVRGFIQNYLKAGVEDLTQAELEISRWKNPTTNQYTDVEVLKLGADKTDAEKIAAAKESVGDLIKTKYYSAETVNLPTSSYGATLSWAVKGTSDLVSVEGNVLTILSIPASSTDVTLTVTITCGSAPADSAEIVISIAPLTTQHEGTEADPYTAADVEIIGATLSNSDYYTENGAPKQIYVTGYIIELGKWDENNKRYSNPGLYMADDSSETKDNSLYVYTISAKDGTPFEKQGDLAVGDLVVLSGYIEMYNNKLEITYYGSSNVNCVSKGPDTRTPAEKIAAALAKVEDTLTITKAGDTTLPTSTVSGVTFEWTVESGDAATVTNNGTVLHVDELPAESATVVLKLTATCESDSDDKTVNVTINAASEPSEGTNEVSYTYSEHGYENEESLDGVDVVVEDVTITFDLNTGKTSPAYYNSGTAARAYHGNSITVSVPQGNTITKITLTATPSNGNAITANVGIFADNVWTGSAQSVVFTVGPKSDGSNGGHVKVTTIAVEYTSGSSQGGGTTPDTPVTPVDGTTVSVSLSDYGPANNWANSELHDTINIDSNITVTVSGGSNTGKYYTNGTSYWNWRIYQTEDPSVTITAASGTILTVKISYEITNTGILTNSDKTVNYDSDEVITVNAGTVSFTVGNTGTAVNGQVRITAIEVVYKVA